MIYGYIRVSTEKQNIENQRHEIIRFANFKEMKVNKWVEETISTRKKLEERTFGKLLLDLSKDDILIVSELSRVGRNLMQIMSVLHLCMERDVKVFAVKEGYELGDNINSKVLAFAFGLSAEIERNLISQRTKESLARLKAEGRVLGRPKGSKKQFPILLEYDAFIKEKIANGSKQVEIARELKVHRHTVKAWIENVKIK
jgi:DNA invertase Pin-like site-specific DNA recombinase